MPSLLLFGSTGLIGSHLVVALKKAHPETLLTVYIRNADETMKQYLTSTVGVDKIVYGDFSEFDKIATLSSEYELIINCGSSWDISLSRAIVAGIEQRVKDGKSKPSLIHISGTGNFIDHGKDGKYKEGKVWNDDSEEDMKLLNPSMLNGGPDAEVLNAGKAGIANTYLIFPSGVYGHALGPNASTALGIIQLFYKLQAQRLGFVPYIGGGSSIMGTIHTEDCYTGILLVLDEALKNPEPKGSVYTRTYILSSQPVSYQDLGNGFAKLLHAQGVVDSPVAKSVPFDEAGEGEMPHLQASNMHVKHDRATRLGWKPTHEGILQFLEAEAKAFS